jgi:hypothetical protein
MANKSLDSLLPIPVHQCDTITARMPYPHEQRALNIGWVPLLVITREKGGQEIYDGTKYVATIVK